MSHAVPPSLPSPALPPHHHQRLHGDQGQEEVEDEVPHRLAAAAQAGNEVDTHGGDLGGARALPCEEPGRPRHTRQKGSRHTHPAECSRLSSLHCNAPAAPRPAAPRTTAMRKMKGREARVLATVKVSTP